MMQIYETLFVEKTPMKQIYFVVIFLTTFCILSYAADSGKHCGIIYTPNTTEQEPFEPTNLVKCLKESDDSFHFHDSPYELPQDPMENLIENYFEIVDITERTLSVDAIKNAYVALEPIFFEGFKNICRATDAQQYAAVF